MNELKINMLMIIILMYLQIRVIKDKVKIY